VLKESPELLSSDSEKDLRRVGSSTFEDFLCESLAANGRSSLASNGFSCHIISCSAIWCAVKRIDGIGRNISRKKLRISSLCKWELSLNLPSLILYPQTVSHRHIRFRSHFSYHDSFYIIVSLEGKFASEHGVKNTTCASIFQWLESESFCVRAGKSTNQDSTHRRMGQDNCAHQWLQVLRRQMSHKVCSAHPLDWMFEQIQNLQSWFCDHESEIYCSVESLWVSSAKWLTRRIQARAYFSGFKSRCTTKCEWQ